MDTISVTRITDRTAASKRREKEERRLWLRKREEKKEWIGGKGRGKSGGCTCHRWGAGVKEELHGVVTQVACALCEKKRS